MKDDKASVKILQSANTSNSNKEHVVALLHEVISDIEKRNSKGR